MSKEFFVHEWLKAHPLFYMLSHMIIMPVFDIYATACDWLMAGAAPPHGLIWFLAVSYLNGIVIEVGRKIRAPHDEEEGVETYTVLWGRSAAAGLACGDGPHRSLRLARVSFIGFAGQVGLLLLVLLSCAAWLSIRFTNSPLPGRGKGFELFSALWTLLMYLSLGAVPLLLRFYHGGL